MTVEVKMFSFKGSGDVSYPKTGNNCPNNCKNIGIDRINNSGSSGIDTTPYDTKLVSDINYITLSCL